jgi:hypothetical protein
MFRHLVGFERISLMKGKSTNPAQNSTKSQPGTDWYNTNSEGTISEQSSAEHKTLKSNAAHTFLLKLPFSLIIFIRSAEQTGQHMIHNSRILPGIMILRYRNRRSTSEKP